MPSTIVATPPSNDTLLHDEVVPIKDIETPNGISTSKPQTTQLLAASSDSLSEEYPKTTTTSDNTQNPLKAPGNFDEFKEDAEVPLPIKQKYLSSTTPFQCLNLVSIIINDNPSATFVQNNNNNVGVPSNPSLTTKAKIKKILIEEEEEEQYQWCPNSVSTINDDNPSIVAVENNNNNDNVPSNPSLVTKVKTT